MKRFIQWWSKPQPQVSDARYETMYIALINLYVLNNLSHALPPVPARDWIENIINLAFWFFLCFQIALVFWGSRESKRGK